MHVIMTDYVWFKHVFRILEYALHGRLSELNFEQRQRIQFKPLFYIVYCDVI